MVVLTHSIQWGSGKDFYQENVFFNDPLFKFIYGYHMPLFMVVSGYLFRRTIQRHSCMEIVTSRLRTLMLPIVTCQTLYLCCLLILGMTMLSVGWMYSYTSALWFLWSALICSFITLIGHAAFKDSLLFHVAVLVMLLLIPAEKLSGLHVFMYPYFVVGFYWNKLNCSKQYRRLSYMKKWSLLMTSFGLYVSLCIFYDCPERSVYVNGVSLQGRPSVWVQLFIDSVRYVYGGLGVAMTMIAVDLWIEGQQLTSNSNLKWLLFLGRNTLGIYIFNYYTTQLLQFIPIDGHYYYMASIVETVMMLMGACTMIWFVRRNRIVRLLILGEK